MKVLIIEDNSGLSELIEEKVKELGFKPYAVFSGNEAIKWLEVNTPHLMILDYGLPDINGQEFIALLENLGKPIPPFIVSTGQGDEHIAVEMMKLGAKDYLMKNNYFLDKLPQVLKRVGKEIENEKKQKKAEDELIESENRFRLLYENAPLPYQSLDAEGYILDVNPAWLSALKYRKEDVIGKHFSDFITPESILVLKERFPKFKSKGEVHDVQFTMIRSDGEHIIVSFEGKIGFDELGSFKQTHCIFSDITHQRAAEDKLKENEQKFRTMLDFTSDWEYWEDENNKIIYTSPSCERITGYSPDELISSPELLNKVVYAEDFEMMSQHHKESYLVENYDKIYTIDFRIVSKAGLIIHMTHICRAIIDEKGKFLGRRVSNRDVTESKLAEVAVRESEEKFRSLFNSNRDSIVVVDKNRIIINANKAMLDEFGYSLKELIGQQTSFIYNSKDEFDDVGKNLKKHIIDKKSFLHIANYKRKDGATFLGETTIFYMKNDNDEALGIVGLIRDITEKRKTEKELEQHRNNLELLVEKRTKQLDLTNRELVNQLEKGKELELQLAESLSKEKEINELKTKFIATVSHEFRTPLAALFSSSQMIQRYSKRWSEEKLNDHYDRIDSTVKYLTQLLDDVLTISRADREILTNNPESLNIENFVNTIFEQLNPQLTERHKLFFTNNLNKEIINIDKKLLNHILLNLLANAIKFSPNGGKIELTIFSDDNNINISVTDNGLGISEDEIKHIFDAFYRAKNSIGINGSGLGLNIIKRSLDVLGGDISVESKVNEGTTFTIRIPVHE